MKEVNECDGEPRVIVYERSTKEGDRVRSGARERRLEGKIAGASRGCRGSEQA